MRDSANRENESGVISPFERSPELEYIELQSYLARQEIEPKSSRYFGDFNLQYPIAGTAIGVTIGLIVGAIYLITPYYPAWRLFLRFYDCLPELNLDSVGIFSFWLFIGAGIGFIFGLFISICKYFYFLLHRLATNIESALKSISLKLNQRQ